jgi:hypothetical protein
VSKGGHCPPKDSGRKEGTILIIRNMGIVMYLRAPLDQNTHTAECINMHITKYQRRPKKEAETVEEYIRHTSGPHRT